MKVKGVKFPTTTPAFAPPSRAGIYQEQGYQVRATLLGVETAAGLATLGTPA